MDRFKILKKTFLPQEDGIRTVRFTVEDTESGENLQGWTQVSLRHLWQMMRLPRFNLRQKFGVFMLLFQREIYPWISFQIFPLLAFWWVRGDLLDWFVPVFVAATIFTTTVDDLRHADLHGGQERHCPGRPSQGSHGGIVVAGDPAFGRPGKSSIAGRCRIGSIRQGQSKRL